MQTLAIVYQRDAGAGVFAEEFDNRGLRFDTWLRAEEDAPPRDPQDYDAVMTFGGAMHVDQEDHHPWLRDQKDLIADLLRRETPLVGVCLGSQMLAEAAGAPPRRSGEPEIGWKQIELTEEGETDPVFGGLPPRFSAFEWHSYEAPLPPGAAPLARSRVCLQAYRVGESAWGVQFHPEVSSEDAMGWIRDYRNDEDAVRMGIDPVRLGEETRAAIEEWNELGRALCGRFIEFAAARSTPA